MSLMTLFAGFSVLGLELDATSMTRAAVTAIEVTAVSSRAIPVAATAEILSLVAAIAVFRLQLYL